MKVLGVQVLYSLVFQVLWSTNTYQYWSWSTFTMMYSVVVHLSTGPAVLFYDVLSCCTVLPPFQFEMSGYAGEGKWV
jgi:hypothetical protein